MIVSRSFAPTSGCPMQRHKRSGGRITVGPYYIPVTRVQSELLYQDARMPKILFALITAVTQHGRDSTRCWKEPRGNDLVHSKHSRLN
ncbi:UNVERIFIED_CONTAM: hypothetical protein FKN15_014558 [Acipenser sinensis]